VYFLIFPFQLSSREIEPILIQQIDELSIGKSLYLFEDKTHTETVDSMKTKIQEFKQSEKPVPNFGYTNSSFWIYFKLTNLKDINNKVLLELSYPLLDEVDYYLLESNKVIKTIQTGDLRPFSQREIYYKNFLFPLELKPQQEYEVFLRIKSEGSVQIPLRLISYDFFIQKEHVEQYVQGIYYGIMFAMIFYNIFLLLSIKDVNYLYYILYTFGIILFSLIYSGYAYELL